MKRVDQLSLALILAVSLTSTRSVAAVCEDVDRDGYATSLDCSTELDCNDDDPYSFPGAPEVCDGVDNDCNGKVDHHPSCPVTCSNPEVIAPITNVSQNGVRSARPRIVWARGAWIVGFDATSASLGAGCSDLWLTRLARNGATLIPPTLVVGATPSDFANPADPSCTDPARIVNGFTGYEGGFAYEFLDQVPIDCAAYQCGCTPARQANMELWVLTHEFGHQFDVNACGAGADKHDTRNAWCEATGGSCVVAPPTTRSCVMNGSVLPLDLGFRADGVDRFCTEDLLLGDPTCSGTPRPGSIRTVEDSQ